MDKIELMRHTLALCREKRADGSGAYCASIAPAGFTLGHARPELDVKIETLRRELGR